MERISALMDGELGGQEAQTTLARLLKEPEVRSEWLNYHLIGDALRDQYLLSIDVTERVSVRLAAEPTVLAPRPRSGLSQQIRRHVLSMAASVAAIAVVGWLAWSSGPLSPVNLASNASTSGSQPGSTVSPSSGIQLASMDKNVRSYLLAHQEYSPTTQIQGVAPYVRTVADAPADGAR